ncbi:MAG: aldo/keto reductase, partial [Aggregatilineales bacterium]
LTGKYSTTKKPDSGRLIENSMYTARYGEDFYYEVAENFTAHAESRGVHPATLAVAWVLAHPGVTSPIIGARNLQQLASSLAAVDVDMTRAWWDEIAELSYMPPPAHDRLEVQKR